MAANANILAALPSDGVTTGAIATKGKDQVNIGILATITRVFRIYFLVRGRWMPHPTGNITHTDGEPAYSADTTVMSGRLAARLAVAGATHVLALEISGGTQAIDLQPV